MRQRSRGAAEAVVFIFVTFIAVSTSVPVSSDDVDDIVQISLLHEGSNPDLRVRRAADSNLPDLLTFGVPVNGDKVELRLKRSNLVRTVTNDEASTQAANRFVENAAVYTDLAGGSAMIVKREADEYNLRGSFMHANKEWNLEPLDRKRRDAGEQNFMRHHLGPMRRKNETISFVGDEVFTPEKGDELINIWRGRGRLGGQQEGQGQHRGQGQQQQQQQQQQGGQQGGNPGQGKGENRRHKRAVTQHVIEIAFIADYSDYQLWVNQVGAADALAEMRLWYTYVSESISVRYQTISDPDIAIRTTVTVLKILTSDDDDDFIESLTNTDGDFSGVSGLNALRNWYPSQSDIPISDHYMLFTGFNIIGATGIAFGSRVCLAAGVSITEETMSGTMGGVAAHELGHSLSGIHDDETADCSDDDQYVMATIFRTPVQAANEGNPWRFSSCSIEDFKTYLQGVSCTLPENTSGDDELPPPVAGQRAGEVLSRDEQCRIAKNDVNSFFCESLQRINGGIESLCGGMYCNLPGTGGSCETTVPQEFTPCNTDKWCVAGRCVDIVTTTTEATTTTTTAEPTTTTTTAEPTTTTTTAEPTTTTTTAEPTTTTTTAEPTTTTTTAEPTTTTTTAEPTTTTTTAEPTTTTTTAEPTTTTTTAEPTTTTTTAEPATTTTTTEEPTTSTTTTTTEASTATTTTDRDTTSTTTESPTTTTTRPLTEETTTTTTSLPTTTTTTQMTTTTDGPGGPTSVSDCTPFIFRRDWRGWWDCIRAALRYIQEERERQREEQRREELQRRREEQRKKKQRRRW